MRFHEIHLLDSGGASTSVPGLGTGHRRELRTQVDPEYDADEETGDGEPYRDGKSAEQPHCHHQFLFSPGAEFCDSIAVVSTLTSAVVVPVSLAFSVNIS
jgi:hypothetical protein